MKDFQQQISIPSLIIGGMTRCPSFDISLESGTITGIYSDVSLIDYIVKQLQLYPNINLHFRQDGHYERLSILESIKFECALYDVKIEMDEVLKMVGLFDKKHRKIKDLTHSQLQRLRLAKLFIHEKPIHILEEPYQNLDNESKQIVNLVMRTLKDKGYAVCLFTTNLTDLILSSDYVFRVDEKGLQPFDFQEEKGTEKKDVDEEKQHIKLEKIPTKMNDKFILFNPPEIDYIESIEGIVNVYVNGDAYPCSLTLNELEKRLLPFGFFRCHRSYIVNLQKVREIITWTKNSYSLILSGKERVNVPLSRSKLVELKGIIGI
ncbi:LytTR family transcriptional regulator DNA-binding domain-containing protein [Rummeliibacillus sp. NPDC094406]|uniref:LytTR family transcriptional regulator DNA-binding domain-containing protein n=1 Tax=Rummeliibacillus sp. NPDC094406 TaxID=3364511 RepID=UPI00382D0153